MYRHSLRWLWNISDGIRRSVAISAGIRLLLVGESLFFVYVCKILVDIATGVSSLAGSLYTILLIACVGLRLLLAGLNVRLLSQSEVRLKNGLRRRLLVRLMGVTPDGRFRRHSGDVLNRLGEDVRVVANLLGRVVPSLVSIVVQFIAAFLITFGTSFGGFSSCHYAGMFIDSQVVCCPDPAFDVGDPPERRRGSVSYSRKSAASGSGANPGT